MDFEKMKAEEKELEALLYGAPDEPATVDDNPTEVAVINDEDFDDDPAGQATDLPEETPTHSTEKVTRTSWKKRYASYKASTDQSIYELRQSNAHKSAEIAALTEDKSSLEEQLREVNKSIAASIDPFEGIVTAEDVDTIGTEAVDIMKKIAQANKAKDNPEIATLLAKVKKMEQEKNDKLKAESVDLRTASMVELKGRLTELMPEWTSIDIEPGFETYMKEVDTISGLGRLQLYNRAIANRDVERILSFYKQYHSLKPRTKQEILATKVTPVGGGSSSAAERTDNTKKIYSIQQYSDFMDSVARGDYRGTKDLRVLAKQLERQYDDALMDDRVR